MFGVSFDTKVQSLINFYDKMTRHKKKLVTTRSHDMNGSRLTVGQEIVYQTKPECNSMVFL